MTPTLKQKYDILLTGMAKDPEKMYRVAAPSGFMRSVNYRVMEMWMIEWDNYDADARLAILSYANQVFEILNSGA